MHYRLTAACAAAAFFLCTSADAQYGGGGTYMPSPTMGSSQMRPRAETVLCPTHVMVVLQPSPAAAGWSTNNTPVAMQPDAKNLPRVESGEMICYYAMPDGYNAFVYFQGLDGRTCTVRSDNTGFECHR